MKVTVIEISFREIQKIWCRELWPARTSPVEPTSWINSYGEIDMAQSLGIPTFIGSMIDNRELISVASGFQTSENCFRSRGLWVHPKYRKMGIGRLMMTQIEEAASMNGCGVLWTMPRLESWHFYLRLGFRKTGSTEAYEYGPHILAQKSVRV